MLCLVVAGPVAATEIAGFEASVAGQTPTAVIAAGRSWLKTARNDPAVSTTDRLAVYAVMLAAARDTSNLRDGNSLARDLVASESAALGADSVERVPGLYLAADWYAYAERWRDARRQLQQAIDLLTTAHGPDDAQLALPLRRIAETSLRDGRDAPVALAALDRALALPTGTTQEATRERAEGFAVRGDWEVVFGDPLASAGWYRAAWQRLADSTWFGRGQANDAFGQPVPIVVKLPEQPFASQRRESDFFAAGVVAFGFTVTPTGTIEDLVLRRNLSPVGAAPDPVAKAMRKARYRPRIQNGVPISTEGHGYEVRFARDPTLPPRRVQPGPIDQRPY